MDFKVDRIGRAVTIYTPPEDVFTVSMDSRTIDGVTVEPGLRVIDYDIRKGAVKKMDHISDGVVWWEITLDNGKRSFMDGGRLWTRLRTNSGVIVATEVD